MVKGNINFTDLDTDQFLFIETKSGADKKPNRSHCTDQVAHRLRRDDSCLWRQGDPQRAMAVPLTADTALDTQVEGVLVDLGE